MLAQHKAQNKKVWSGLECGQRLMLIGRGGLEKDSCNSDAKQQIAPGMRLHRRVSRLAASKQYD